MNCPKCKALLFLEQEKQDKAPEYHCIGCGMHGTLEQMIKQKKASDHIFELTLSKVTCKLCEKKIRTTEAKIVPSGISQAYICREHKETSI